MYNHIPSPKWTTLGHAVRWINDFTPCLSPEDAFALDDAPCVIVRDFQGSRDKLLLAIRHKKIKIECQNFVLCNDRSNRYLRNFDYHNVIAFSELDMDLLKCREELEIKSYSFADFDLEAIPHEMLISSCFAWNENTIYTHESEGWQFQCYNLRVSVPDLYREFPSQIAEASNKDGDFTPQERRSAMKLILAMAIAKYRYDPDAKTSEATSKIQGDIERLGMSIDPKTIRKFLKEAVHALIPRD